MTLLDEGNFKMSGVRWLAKSDFPKLFTLKYAKV